MRTPDLCDVVKRTDQVMPFFAEPQEKSCRSEQLELVLDLRPQERR
jgi:hypothetical protein